MDAKTNHSKFHLMEGSKVEAWKKDVTPLLADYAIYMACDSEPLFYKLNAIRSDDIQTVPEYIQR